MPRVTSFIKPALSAMTAAMIGACAAQPGTGSLSRSVPAPVADKVAVVDCLLPGQLRRLGGNLTYLSPRRPIRTSAADCEIRGGELTASIPATQL